MDVMFTNLVGPLSHQPQEKSLGDVIEVFIGSFYHDLEIFDAQNVANRLDKTTGLDSVTWRLLPYNHTSFPEI